MKQFWNFKLSIIKTPVLYKEINHTKVFLKFITIVEKVIEKLYINCRYSLSLHLITYIRIFQRLIFMDNCNKFNNYTFYIMRNANACKNLFLKLSQISQVTKLLFLSWRNYVFDLYNLRILYYLKR